MSADGSSARERESRCAICGRFPGEGHSEACPDASQAAALADAGAAAGSGDAGMRDILIQALAFYADEERWALSEVSPRRRPQDDRGAIARRVLEKCGLAAPPSREEPGLPDMVLGSLDVSVFQVRELETALSNVLEAFEKAEGRCPGCSLAGSGYHDYGCVIVAARGVLHDTDAAPPSRESEYEAGYRQARADAAALCRQWHGPGAREAFEVAHGLAAQIDALTAAGPGTARGDVDAG